MLLGPSGSGKTTLLRCLAGIERLDSGRSHRGRPVATTGSHVPPEQRDLSMVFQDYALWPHLTAGTTWPSRCGGGACPAERRPGRWPCSTGSGSARSPTGTRTSCPAASSSGSRSPGRSIADTGLILCDEPLSNLDADLRERMRVEISSLVREAGATTVYITHDQAEAFALADQIGVLEEGGLVQFGPPEEVYTQPATPFVARFTGLAGELPVRVAGTRRCGGPSTSSRPGRATGAAGRGCRGWHVPGATQPC